MTTSEKPACAPVDLVVELERIAANTKTWNRLMTTKAKIGQTPKELVWTLNKAKLYHYIPVVPAEQRHPIPLLLVFAIMNRPHVLDLRPGHSFVEYMLERGYDIYLLDWGVPGPEDKHTTFDDYTLEYLPRAIRKLKAVTGSAGVQHARLVPRRADQHALRGTAPRRWAQESGAADRAAGFLRQDRPAASRAGRATRPSTPTRWSMRSATCPAS